MDLVARAVCTTLALVAMAPAQIVTYKSYEDYCAHNPDAGSCYKGKPLDMNSIQLPPGFQLSPPTAPTGTPTPAVRPPRRPAATPSPAPALPPAAMNSPVTPPRAHRTRGPADIRLGELDWRLVQPDSDMLIGLNMAGLAESELARSLIGQWAGKLGATDAERQKLIAALGDIPQAVISIQRKEVLAVLMGRVDDLANQATIGGLQTVRVSADTIAVGSRSALKWAMFRLNFKEALPATVQDAKQLARTNDFWVVGKPQAFAALGQRIRRDTPVTRFKLGVSIQDQFRMDMFLETAAPAAAAKLLQASQKGAPRGMQATVEGNTVHYALAIDRDTALQRFAGFMTEPIGKQFAPLLTAARQMAARQAASSTRSAPGKIVIDGLDDGPKEIPLSPKQ